MSWYFNSIATLFFLIIIYNLREIFCVERIHQKILLQLQIVCSIANTHTNTLKDSIFSKEFSRNLDENTLKCALNLTESVQKDSMYVLRVTHMIMLLCFNIMN